jgi:hypothetical protein
MHRGSRLLVLLLVSACTDDASIDSVELEIVSGTPDSGDPATVYLDLGGGSCTGTLVSPKSVLTAKHCIEGTSAGQVSVFFGSDSRAAGTWIDATRLVGHPTTDIAMIAMAEPGPTMWIPLSETTLVEGMVGQQVRIVGFGVTGENESDAGLKRQGMTALSEIDGDVMFVGSAGSKTCYGDSGGPAFMAFGGVEHVAGVTSFGTDICEQGLSGEIRVDPYVDWIRSFIDANDPPSCASDTRCVTSGCAGPDPDCPTPDPGTDPGGEEPGGVDDTDPSGEPPPPEPPQIVGGDLQGNCAIAVGGGGAGSAVGVWLLALLLTLARRRARRAS